MQRRLTTRTRYGRQVVVVAVGLAAASASALAGACYEHDGVALRGYDPVASFLAGTPVKGSAAHRDAFAAAPAQYAPHSQGFCACGVAQGSKAVIDPAAFTIGANKLSLNDNARIQRRWRADIAGFYRRRRIPSIVIN